MQPPRSQLETYRDWSPAWLASWFLFDIAFPSPFPSPPLFPSFSFLPRRKLFIRGILVVQDESGGYLLSIDRFWQHAKSFWPSLRGLTSPFIYPSFSLLPFFAPFSYRPHFFFDPEPSHHYFTSLFFFYRSDAFSLSLCTVFDGCFLVFICLSFFYLCILFSLVILSRGSSVHFTFISKTLHSWVSLEDFELRHWGLHFCRRSWNQSWEFITLTYNYLNSICNCEKIKYFKILFFTKRKLIFDFVTKSCSFISLL